jgi:hypothetical protein
MDPGSGRSLTLVALLAYAQHRYPFNWHTFAEQLRLANWSKIALGVACIYLAYVFRAVRWALLLRHNKRVPLFSLLGTQVIGFTAVALIGRVADPVRPYLVAKRTGLPLSNQIAVYIVERLFDAGSMALIFSSAILLTAWFGAPGALPHAEVVKRAGYWGLALTVLGAVFLVVVRLAGRSVAWFVERAFGLLSKKLGAAAGDKIRSFHAGLDIMRSFSDFGVTASLSLGMWMLISLAYLVTMRAFVASPQLASMTAAGCVLLLAVSGGASVFQLPILGWFTQISAFTWALVTFFSVAWEPATACAATILLVTFLAVIPVGLIWARVDHVNLRKVTVESEHADGNLSEALQQAETNT